MKHRRQRAEHIRSKASKKLRTNLRILTIVYSILFLLTIYNVAISPAQPWQIIFAIMVGLAAGIISARMYKISWSHDESEVIGKIDTYGFVVLGLFVVFELNRTHVAELFSTGSAVGSVGLVLITSTLFGRIVGTARQIIHVLEKEKII